MVTRIKAFQGGTDPLSANVGLDAWDFKPVSEQQILAWFTFRHADQSK